ncbi:MULTISPECIES: hypothetical protein [unclassified Streptomyces]|uniref:hypothetical protein n=1 Tax=unclassified Streptomyces TaxID=2593676 RepID=UPI002E2C7483|nr:hypothetical protein [Streptomyces sp. NBC_00223]
MNSFDPGGRLTQSVSVSFHEETLAAVRDRVGERGLSAYVENAARRQIEGDALDALIRDHEEQHGGITEEEILAAEADLFGHGTSSRDAA